MSVLQANVDLAISIFKARIGDEYVFGGAFSPTDVQQGTDCSGMCDTILQALTHGPDMQWGRHVSTESWPYDYGGDLAVATGTPGPYGTVCAGDAQPGPPPTQYPPQIPGDAAAIVYLMHGGGGENSHMMIAVNDGSGQYVVMETGGAHDDTGGNGPYASPNGPATATDDPEWTDIWYLPGPVEGGTQPPPPPPPLSRPDQYALTIIQTGQKLGVTPRGIQIALATALVESNLTMYANSNDPDSLNYPHDAVGSDHMSVGLFQQQDQGWGPLSCRMDAACSATTFYQRLEQLRYNDPNKSPGSFAQAVQVSAFPDRYDQRFNDAVALYNRLVNIPTPGGFLMALTDQQQQQLYNVICGQVTSQSPFRHLTEGAIWEPAQMWVNGDGMTHPQYVEWAASRGDPVSLAVLNELATADPNAHPDRAPDIDLARTVLARVQTPSQPAPTKPASDPLAAPDAAPAPVAPTPTGNNSIGPSGWIGIAGVVAQGVLWLLQQSVSVLSPQWAAGVSGFLALLTTLGIYKAPDQAQGATNQPPPPAPAPPPPPPPPPPVAAPPPRPGPASGSISDALANTQHDVEELAAKTEALRDSIKKTLG